MRAALDGRMAQLLHALQAVLGPWACLLLGCKQPNSPSHQAPPEPCAPSVAAALLRHSGRDVDREAVRVLEAAMNCLVAGCCAGMAGDQVVEVC